MQRLLYSMGLGRIYTKETAAYLRTPNSFGNKCSHLQNTRIADQVAYTIRLELDRANYRRGIWPYDPLNGQFVSRPGQAHTQDAPPCKEISPLKSSDAYLDSLSTELMAWVTLTKCCYVPNLRCLGRPVFEKFRALTSTSFIHPDLIARCDIRKYSLGWVWRNFVEQSEADVRCFKSFFCQQLNSFTMNCDADIWFTNR
ncbi:LOW QUALITY PROTEIN: hypothetical protein T265_12499 [Opisthorchis viverrini]|uniref:Uncharacterized protein n=1 Tax=Opisthorchis viverrini TaxID=6198 RepID=A0A075AJW2_OPIVI|nr:LOW QUALITY PROTEIN: hypothetical protein T265_12499 [Opisthorchis viverrini]KER34079.1 LOW QUALITY PROTEIN: hypothetical protein T265_12499 [Opisthorchis viverrini]